MMDAEFTKGVPDRRYPYLAERTDDQLDHMVVIFIYTDRAIKIGRHSFELMDLDEDDYTPIQGTFTLTFGSPGERFPSGDAVLETRGPLQRPRP